MVREPGSVRLMAAGAWRNWAQEGTVNVGRWLQSHRAKRRSGGELRRQKGAGDRQDGDGLGGSVMRDHDLATVRIAAGLSLCMLLPAIPRASQLACCTGS